jgi:hypothetical protein
VACPLSGSTVQDDGIPSCARNAVHHWLMPPEICYGLQRTRRLHLVLRQALPWRHGYAPFPVVRRRRLQPPRRPSPSTRLNHTPPSSKTPRVGNPWPRRRNKFPQVTCEKVRVAPFPVVRATGASGRSKAGARRCQTRDTMGKMGCPRLGGGVSPPLSAAACPRGSLPQGCETSVTSVTSESQCELATKRAV